MIPMWELQKNWGPWYRPQAARLLFYGRPQKEPPHSWKQPYGWLSKLWSLFLVPVNIRCRIILSTKKGTRILITTHIPTGSSPGFARTAPEAAPPPARRSPGPQPRLGDFRLPYQTARYGGRCVYIYIYTHIYIYVHIRIVYVYIYICR